MCSPQSTFFRSVLWLTNGIPQNSTKKKESTMLVPRIMSTLAFEAANKKVSQLIFLLSTISFVQ